MIPMQSPDIIRMLMRTRERAIKPQILRVGSQGLIYVSLFE
jgi:hypothetical protein